jgi:hypothetical protein
VGQQEKQAAPLAAAASLIPNWKGQTGVTNCPPPRQPLPCAAHLSVCMCGGGFRWAVWLRLRSAVRERARQAAYSGPGTHGASIDLDVPLSPPLTTKATDSRTHAKLSGGLLDSDTFTGQYAQPNTSAAPGAQKATEVKDNEAFGQQTIQASGKLPRKRQQLGIAPLSTAGFKSEGTRSSLIGASQCFVATRSKSSPTLDLRTPLPRASNKR